MDGTARLQRRRQFFFGLIISTVIAGFFAVFISLWRGSPHWTFGQWSFSVQYSLAATSAREGLLRDYHRALDNGYSHWFNQWLEERLDGSTGEERVAILRFFALRAGRARQSLSLCERGPGLIGEVLAASAGQSLEDKRGAVMLMVCLRRKNILKLFWHPDTTPDGLIPDEQMMVEQAWAGYAQWWTLPENERENHDPLASAGVTIESP